MKIITIKKGFGKMAKKTKNSGLGRGLDSLIPKVEEKEVEEGISLEDLLKKSEKESEEETNEVTEEVTNEVNEEVANEEEIAFDDEPDEDEKELVFSAEEDADDEIMVEEEDVEKYEEEIVEEEVDESEESSQYTNVFFNDDVKIKDHDNAVKTHEEIAGNEGMKNIKSTVNIKEGSEETTKIIEASDDINEVTSLLSEKEEKLVDEVIETVENNPRITLWSARSAAVLRYLRKTEPEFSISNEASNLIDAAIAEKYPEIWTLFNHL